MEQALFIKSVEANIVPMNAMGMYTYMEYDRLTPLMNGGLPSSSTMIRQKQVRMDCAMINGRRIYHCINPEVVELLALHVERLTGRAPIDDNTNVVVTHARAIDLDLE